MGVIYTIDILALLGLVAIALQRGVEQTLPFAAFVFVLVPRDAAIQLPGLFDLTTQRILLIALTALYVLLPTPTTRRPRLDRTLQCLIVAHIAWCLISVANSIVPMMSLKKMVSEVLEYYLLYYIFVKAITKMETINRLLFAIVAAVIASSCFGAIEAYSDWSIMQLFPTVAHSFEGWSTTGAASGRDQRITSTFASPILFGAGLVMGIVLALYLIKVTKTSGKKILLWSGLLLMFLNLYKTSSRGPWLGLILSLGIIFFWDTGRIRKYLTVVAILCVAVVVIRPGVWDTIENIYIATFDPQSPLGSSYEYRYALRDLAVKALSQDVTRSLWGYGMESFYYLGLEGDLYGRPYKFLSCDSAWLELMVETGYVGLLIISLILILPLWYSCRAIKKGPDRVPLYLVTVMFSYYFMMLSAAMYGWGQTGYILWMTIAAGLAYTKVRERTTASRPDLLHSSTEAELATLPQLSSVNCCS
jgi:O-antigen ligase